MFSDQRVRSGPITSQIFSGGLKRHKSRRYEPANAHFRLEYDTKRSEAALTQVLTSPREFGFLYVGAGFLTSFSAAIASAAASKRVATRSHRRLLSHRKRANCSRSPASMAAPRCHLLFWDTAVKERRRTMDKLPGHFALIETAGALFGLAFSVALIVAVFSVAMTAFFHAFGF